MCPYIYPCHPTCVLVLIPVMSHVSLYLSYTLHPKPYTLNPKQGATGAIECLLKHNADADYGTKVDAVTPVS